MANENFKQKITAIHSDIASPWKADSVGKIAELPWVTRVPSFLNKDHPIPAGVAGVIQDASVKQ